MTEIPVTKIKKYALSFEYDDWEAIRSALGKRLEFETHKPCAEYLERYGWVRREIKRRLDISTKGK